jgi:hypothetical protein
MKKHIYIFFVLIVVSSSSIMATLPQRVGAQLGGIFFIMGYGFSPGGFYQLAFHRNFALEINGNYNFGVMPLGGGPTHSGGLDISLQAMLYNFGTPHFSKGFGVGLGGGFHYLADFNQNLYLEKQEDNYVSKKGTFLLFPMHLEVFYQHLFDNNWFIKSGFKGYVAQITHQLEGPKIDSGTAAKILPSAYFAVGYSF